MRKLFCYLLIVSFGIFLSKRVKCEELPKEIITKSGIKMVLIPGGWFIMGNKNGKKDEKPAHKVYVSSFYMDKYEVTQKSFEKLMGYNPSNFANESNPVDRVRWTEAALYCNERSKREGLTPVYNEKTWEINFKANGYRLPTEAEWEYAARGGKKGIYFFGNNKNKLNLYAWYKKNSRKKTHPVGKKKPNPYGLYDILGNLWEWCNDWYQEDYYKISPLKNPVGPIKPVVRKKVLRGGSWLSDYKKVNVTVRLSDDPANADICQGYDIYGFRCVRPVFVKKK